MLFVIVLSFDVTLIPADCLPELVVLKLSSVIPSALNLNGIPPPPTPTTGLPPLVSSPFRISCLFTSTFS